MKITVGRGSCGNAAGAAEISALLEAGVECAVNMVGCIGVCYLEPVVDVIDDNGDKRTFVRVDDAAAGEIIKLACGEANEAAKYELTAADAEALNNQHRIALANCGIINPESIGEYIAAEGYKAAEKAVKELTPEQVIDQIKLSGLGGRGGAGFPTWFKWNAARDSAGDKKYMICNADEGDPGAFMDRAIIEGDPHSVIEGMLIGAYAMGADEGIVYVRAEYPLAILRLQSAIEQARARGMLGNNLFGSDFSFDLRIKEGAGAFVCGEETALIASLEGDRGMPRLKPPFPAQKGYWQKPSNINNVETLANIPWIIRNGGEAFAAIGTENSKGTKVFALAGKIKNGGLVEIPMGRNIDDVIFGLGGGIKDGGKFKAVQMGGPSGGCIPAELGNTVIDYKSINATGAIMGSGGMVVLDDTTCMVDIARFFLDFTRKESCGKCTHCRIGTRRMLEILERICEGQGNEEDIPLLEDLSEQIRAGSLCQLGQTAPNPVLTTIRYFRNEYEAHIRDKKCLAKQCKSLLTFGIDEQKCVGCTLCKRKCPTEAIIGEVKKCHVIDADKCIKCGECAAVCRFDAVAIT